MTRFGNLFARLHDQFGVWFSRMFIIALLSFLFFVALGGVSHNSKWQIFQIKVTGATTISSDTVRSLALEKILGNYFLVYARNNSFLFPIGEIEQSLLDLYPQIASVSVNRIDDHSIVINISERKPYALWCGEEFSLIPRELIDCWFIDNNGFIFDQAPVFSSGVYLEVYSKLIEKNEGEPLRAGVPYERFYAADSFVKLLREEVGEPLRVSLKPEGEAEVTLRTSAIYPFLAGVIVRFKDEEIPQTLVKTLRAAISREFPDNTALKKKLLYIDMRFGNKIFFGFEN
ncbi:MAG: FtsQ-type POTRA domain-containing protein [Candidatus Yonathbacteria bacterium]|nr:FtsQ-type POTRA domain-containing protein [Candidatus Yonathbacteria bacterium]